MPDEMTPAVPRAAGEDSDARVAGGAARPWLASYPPGVPRTYDYPRVPLTRLLDDAAQDFPDGVAVDFLGGRTTYRELLDAADRLAGALAGLGIRRGDRVAAVLPDCPQHLVVLFAAWRLGAVVSEHDAGADAVRLERELNHAGCRVVVCLDEAYRTLARLKGRLRSVAHIVATRLTEALPPWRRPAAALRERRRGSAVRIPEREGVLRLQALVERTAPVLSQARIGASDLAVLMYGGAAAQAGRGGGAAPAGVMFTHANLIAAAFQTRLWLPDVQAGREVVLAGAPLSRAYGLAACMLQGVLSAATLLLLPRYDPALVRRTVQRRKPTVLVAEAPVYAALTGGDDKRQDLPWVRVCLSGGGELSEPVARTIERRTGGKLREGWGPAEAPLTHANPVYGRAKTDTVGLPLPDTLCTVVDPGDHGRPVAAGVTGELLVSGPQVARGQWNPAERVAAPPARGWLRTRTLARMDAEGYFTILGPARGR